MGAVYNLNLPAQTFRKPSLLQMGKKRGAASISFDMTINHERQQYCRGSRQKQTSENKGILKGLPYVQPSGIPFSFGKQYSAVIVLFAIDPQGTCYVEKIRGKCNEACLPEALNTSNRKLGMLREAANV